MFNLNSLVILYWLDGAYAYHFNPDLSFYLILSLKIRIMLFTLKTS